MKSLIPIFIILSMALTSCYNVEDLPDTNKITYIVTGDTFDAIYKDETGTNQYVYNREGSFKVYVEDVVGDPVFLLAKGSDNVKVRIIVKDGIDTVRKAKDTGGGTLVFIDYVPEKLE
jgi:hypothetical protein